MSVPGPVRARRGRPRLACVALAAVLSVLTACAASPPAPAGALRVMTWNVQTREHDPREWADVIARYRPDVLGLEEICSGEALDLAELLRRDHGLAYEALPGPIRPPGTQEANAPVNAELGPTCGTGPDDVAFGLAVLSRLPVSGGPVVTLYPPDHRDEQRGYLTVRVTAASGPVTVLVTHVGLAGVQGQQIRLLADAATRAPGPVVVLGDLNLEPGAEELAPLRGALAEVDPAGRYPTTEIGKIDYIFVRGLGIAGAPETPAVTSSDHRPLVDVLTRSP